VVESFLHQLVAAPAVASQIGPGRDGPFRPRREDLRSLVEIGFIVVAILLGSGVTQVDSPVWATILAILTAVALVAGVGLRIHRLWTED
jgi:hypothetical protein